MPPLVQRIHATRLRNGKSFHVVFLTGTSGALRVLALLLKTISGSDSESSSPEGIDGKGPSGAPANLKL